MKVAIWKGYRVLKRPVRNWKDLRSVGVGTAVEVYWTMQPLLLQSAVSNYPFRFEAVESLQNHFSCLTNRKQTKRKQAMMPGGGEGGYSYI